MANIKHKNIFDAGTSTPARISPEYNDGTSGQNYETAPRSGYAISEERIMVFTDDKILEKAKVHSTIADGNVRPGHAG